MKEKELFEMDRSTATPSETRAAFATGLHRVADDLQSGADGSPPEQSLHQMVVIFDFDGSTRAAALTDDPLRAYHMAYHAIQKALFREMVRRAEAGETLQVCPDVLDAFIEYLGEEGKDVQIDDSAVGGMLTGADPVSPTKH